MDNIRWKIEHIGVIVYDVENSVKRFADLLGIKPWSIWTIAPPFLTDTFFHGEKVTHSFKVATVNLGNVELELLAPLEGKSVYAEHLRKNGEGLHHIALTPVSTKQELEKVVTLLENKGGEIIQSGTLGDAGSYYYVNTKEANLVLELSNTGRGAMPPPDKIYP
jgi:catechol 2,3-dioxygenase-like lactoylglutathione lyase family enzyme